MRTTAKRPHVAVIAPPAIAFHASTSHPVRPRRAAPRADRSRQLPSGAMAEAGPGPPCLGFCCRSAHAELGGACRQCGTALHFCSEGCRVSFEARCTHATLEPLLQPRSRASTTRGAPQGGGSTRQACTDCLFAQLEAVLQQGAWLVAHLDLVEAARLLLVALLARPDLQQQGRCQRAGLLALRCLATPAAAPDPLPQLLPPFAAEPGAWLDAGLVPALASYAGALSCP
jgi:hypothetical protein